jgi:hypothetical protein
MAQMPIAHQLWSLWEKRLSKAWKPIFKQVGLNLSTRNEDAFLRGLNSKVTVNRKYPGLQDFAADGVRGIEPFDPARSLFYHVLASPLVVPPNLSDSDYPTLDELNVIERYIYSVNQRSLDDVLKTAQNGVLAVVVFAYEYVPAGQTTHHQHADLCFSRTGIARVGNAPPKYIGKARGFFPYTADKKKIHVVPVRYGAFLATQFKGSQDFVERFTPDDAKRNFWVPLHMLFDGGECLKGLSITVKFHAFHRNEKIRKVHLALNQAGIPTGWNAKKLTQFPFVITDRLAGFDRRVTGLLAPVVHDPLIQPAKTGDGKLVDYPVPLDGQKSFLLDPVLDKLNASVWFKTALDTRSSSEFVNARHVIRARGLGKVVDQIGKNPRENINDFVKKGGYRAVNFIDWTGDGFVEAACDGLPVSKPPELKPIPSIAAYSILGQPDFFPLVKQQDLTEWKELPDNADLKKLIWPADLGVNPVPLSSERSPGNISLSDSSGKPVFTAADSDAAAVIGMRRTISATTPGFPSYPDIPREAILSYRASSLFEPGWDVSEDFGRDPAMKTPTKFLANYGLGSPFAEDTLICAAFGAFWPGAVPDVTRLFTLEDYPSSTPILDKEVGFSGVPLPAQNGRNGDYLFRTYGYPDFVHAIWKKELAYNTFARVTLKEYLDRSMATARIFKLLGIFNSLDRAKIAFLNFRKATEADYARGPRDWPSPREHTYWVKTAEIRSAIPNPRNYPVTDAKLEKQTCLLASYDAVYKIVP